MVTLLHDTNPYILSYKNPLEKYKVKQRVKLACFDLDWTLTFNEKKLFPNDPDDIILMPNRKNVLTKYNKTHLLVVFTNQYVRSKRVALERVERVTTFITKLNLPIICFIATDKDEYRKPEIGMYLKLKELLDVHNITITSSFYCGDALGRPQDFDNSDKQFAENMNMKIFSPEEIFPEVQIDKSCFTEKTMIIFVGMPGSGKTLYYQTHFDDYEHINQDELKTFPKILHHIRLSMEVGENIVVDSTNPKNDTRFEYYKLAKEYGYFPVIIYFARNGVGWNNLRENKVPTIVYHKYFKNLDSPIGEKYMGNDITTIII